MPRNVVRILLVLMLSALCGSAWAQGEAAEQAQPLSLQECIDIAMRNQVDVLVAHNNVTAAESRRAQAWADYLPHLSIQNNAFVWGGSEGVLTKSTTGTAFNISQNIYDGGLREASVSAAKHGVTQSSARLSRTEETVAYSVTQAYYELLRQQHLADVAGADVKYSEELKRQVEARIELGDAAKVDVLPVESQLATARVGLINARNSVRTASLQLQNAMGLTSRPQFAVQDVGAPPEVELQPLTDYITAALAHRPDVVETKASVGAAKASVRTARLSLYPRPVISGQYQQEISGGFTTSSTQVIGGFVFDIFNGGANRAAFREAKAQQASAEQQAAQMGKDIQVQVEEAYLNLTSAQERMAASAIGLEAAQKNYEVQKDRYNQGLAITLDLLNAELQVITAQTNDVQARYDYYTALAQLNYSTGKQVVADAG